MAITKRKQVASLGNKVPHGIGSYDNDENTLINYDAKLAQAYYTEWQSMYEAIPNDRLCNVEEVYLPMVVKP